MMGNYLETFGLAAQNSQDIVFAYDQVFFTVNFDLRSGKLSEENVIALFDFQWNLGSIFQNPAISSSHHQPFLGLLFGGVGNNDSTLNAFLLFDSFEQNAIMQGSDLHRSDLLSHQVCVAPEGGACLLLLALVD